MFFFFFQAEDGIRDGTVTGVQTCALPISGCGADGNDVLHDWLPCRRLCGASLGQLIVSERFGTSARKVENGFVRRRNVSSPSPRRNIRAEIRSNFNDPKIGRLAAQGESCSFRAVSAGVFLTSPRLREEVKSAPKRISG